MAFSIKRKRLAKVDGALSGQEAPNINKRKRMLLILLFMILLASNIFLFNRLVKSRKTIIYQQQTIENAQEPQDASSEVDGKWLGLCKKGSIHSVDDFKKTLENDPVLALYFYDFDFRYARMGNLEEPLWTYIAYRKNDRISITKRAVRLKKGDGYITDGKRRIRTFCCNDYVDASIDESVDAPMPLDEWLKKYSKYGPRNSNFAAVPEPSTIFLMGFGLSVLGMIAIYRKRAHRLVTRRKRRSCRPLARS